MKLIKYIIRWQLSTPIIAMVLWLLSDLNITLATIIANFIGALIFFPLDKIIFKKKYDRPIWEIKEGICDHCGKTDIIYRIISWGKYNREDDKNPKFLCRNCSLEKMNLIRYKKGDK